MCFKNNNFILKNLFLLILYILISVMWISIYKNCEEIFIKILSLVVIVFSIFSIIFYILAFIGYFIYYCSFKKANVKKSKNTLTVNEDGITDDITLSSKWEQLTYVVVGEHYIMITTTSNISYIFPIGIKSKLISCINKYNTNKELKIIEKNI